MEQEYGVVISYIICGWALYIFSGWASPIPMVLRPFRAFPHLLPYSIPPAIQVSVNILTAILKTSDIKKSDIRHFIYFLETSISYSIHACINGPMAFKSSSRLGSFT